MKSSDVTIGMKFEFKTIGISTITASVDRITKSRIIFNRTIFSNNFYGKSMFQEMLDSKEVKPL